MKLGRLKKEEATRKEEKKIAFIQIICDPLKKLKGALAGVAQWIECQPAQANSRRFDSQLQARSLVGGTQVATTRCFSPFLSPSLSSV